MWLHNLCALLKFTILFSCFFHIPAVDPPRRLVDVASSLCPSLRRVHVALVWVPLLFTLNPCVQQ